VSIRVLQDPVPLAIHCGAAERGRAAWAAALPESICLPDGCSAGDAAEVAEFLAVGWELSVQQQTNGRTDRQTDRQTAGGRTDGGSMLHFNGSRVAQVQGRYGVDRQVHLSAGMLVCLPVSVATRQRAPRCTRWAEPGCRLSILSMGRVPRVAQAFDGALRLRSPPLGAFLAELLQPAAGAAGAPMASHAVSVVARVVARLLEAVRAHATLHPVHLRSLVLRASLECRRSRRGNTRAQLPRTR
jgi:hypothetical protein